MAPPPGTKKGGNGADGAPTIVGDARFKKVHNDPRFARLSAKKNKLQIDKRFAAVLKDDRFQSVQGKYDKYGRRIDKKENELKKFYRLNEDDDAQASSSDEEAQDKAVAKPSIAKAKSKAKAPAPASSSDEDDEEDSDAESDDEAAEGDAKMTRLDYLNRMARGELVSGSDTSDDSEASDEDIEMEDDEDDEKEDIPVGEETTRFAVMNCDWTRIRAVDLFALFQSFAPATGAVKDVTIYPSDFGLKKMKEEEQHGPRVLWEDKEKKSMDIESDDKQASDDETAICKSEGAEKPTEVTKDTDEDSESDEERDEEGYDSEDPLGVKQTVTANESDGFDVEKLRKYELQKLKYYYAVVTCDSVKTAATIYENCDQLEYETSANLLDLRFIPDDMDFTNTPKEACGHVPETYKPSIFATQALQQTEVKLTWEEDDDRRLELLTRQAEWKDAHDDDFAAYLASENSSSEGEDDDSEDEKDSEAEVVETETETETARNDKSRVDRKKAAKLRKIKNRYRKMLLGSDAEDSDGSGSEMDETKDGASDDDNSADEKPEGMDSDSDDGDAGDNSASGDMEMSFTPGAGDILRAKKQKELEANETPFERYVREKKQEKNKKRHDKRTLQKERAGEQKAVLKTRGKAAPEALQALRAAIDDHDADENDSDRNFDMKKIAHSEKAKKLKGKRKHKELKKLDHKSGLQEGFEFDAVDPRFGKLYEKGSQFQLDPTDPKFKKTEATQAIFQERRNRQAHPQSKISKQHKNVAKAMDEGSTREKKDAKNELNAMVENLKRKGTPTTNSKGKPAMKPFKKPKF